MTYQPTPKQALCLFGMLFGQSEAEREPMQSKVKPDLTPKERKILIDAGLLETQARGRAKHLVPTDAAWRWADAHLDCQLAASVQATNVLRGVLTQLGKFLAARDLTLSDVVVASPGPRMPKVTTSEGDVRPEARFSTPLVQEPSASTIETDASPNELGERIRRVIREIAGGVAKRRVRLAELRARLDEVPRSKLDSLLLELQDAGRVVLYPLDNPVELTSADRNAALFVGPNPRHVIYLES